MSITWKSTDKGSEFYYNGSYAGAALCADGFKDHFVVLNDDVVRWDRISDVDTDKASMCFVAPFKMTYEMIPRLMYDENKDDRILDRNMMQNLVRNADPAELEISYIRFCKDEKSGEPWRIPWWYDSIPGAVYSESENLSVAAFLPPDQMDASFSNYSTDKETIYEYVWPEEMGPRMPSETADGELFELDSIGPTMRPPWVDGYNKTIEPRKNFSIILVFQEVDRPKTAWHRLIAVSWEMYKKYVPPKFSNEELRRLGYEFAKSLYCKEEDGFETFASGKIWGGKEFTIRHGYEIGWCGQSGGLSVAMLVKAVQDDDKEACAMGLKGLDSWINATAGNGLIPTHYPTKMSNHFGRNVIDAINLYHAVKHMFSGYEYARMLGYEKPEYFKAACDICDFAVSKMNKETGSIGKSWYEDTLEPAVTEGTCGVFLSWALCVGYQYTGKKAYLDAAVKSYDYYYNDFITRGYSIGGALDIFTIDKESGIPILTAGLLLYEFTGNDKYLDCAEDAAWYLSTWQWCYTMPFIKGRTLNELNYNTYGGTGISMQDAQQDPYALLYVHALYDLADYTGDETWAERAHAIWINGMDGISDGTMVADGRPIPCGAQHECRFMGSRYQDVFQWLVAWPTAFRLMNMWRTDLLVGDRKGRTL